MQALTLNAETHSATLTTNVPIPTPSPTEVLVHIHAVALNPVDSLYIAQPLGTTGRILGSDFAGVVTQLGSRVTTSLQLGDRVAGFVQGACSKNDLPGAFADYVAIDADLVWRLPEGMELRHAAAVSLCGLTAAQALFLRMGLKAPFAWNNRTEDERPVRKGAVVFIYGASTSVGMYAAQLVQAANKAHGLGITLVGAASGKHFGYLKAEPYYYDHLVDYRSDWEGQIRQIASNGLGIAYDCISEGQTVSKIAHLFKGSGKMAIVRSRQGGAWSQEATFSLEPSYGAVWEGLGKEVQYQGMHLPNNDTARDFTVAFYKWLSEGNSLSPNPVRSMPNGLVGIKDDGLPLLGYGTMDDRGHERSEAWMRPISGEKLVYEFVRAD